MSKAKNIITENKDFDFDAYFAACDSNEWKAELKKEEEEAEQKVYAEKMNRFSMEVKDFRSLKTCKKCSGTGELKSFRHVAMGVCFSCGGYGKK